jgi:hypothetical protein
VATERRPVWLADEPPRLADDGGAGDYVAGLFFADAHGYFPHVAADSGNPTLTFAATKIFSRSASMLITSF